LPASFRAGGTPAPQGVDGLIVARTRTGAGFGTGRRRGRLGLMAFRGYRSVRPKATSAARASQPHTTPRAGRKKRTATLCATLATSRPPATKPGLPNGIGPGKARLGCRGRVGASSALGGTTPTGVSIVSVASGGPSACAFCPFAPSPGASDSVAAVWVVPLSSSWALTLWIDGLGSVERSASVAIAVPGSCCRSIAGSSARASAGRTGAGGVWGAGAGWPAGATNTAGAAAGATGGVWPLATGSSMRASAGRTGWVYLADWAPAGGVAAG
jgi:hypothetical protein